VARQGATLAPASLHVESQTDSGQAEPAYVVQAQDIDISAPASVAMLAEGLPMPWRRWLYAGNPEGTVGATRTALVRQRRFRYFRERRQHGLACEWTRSPVSLDLSGIVRGDQLALTMGLTGHNELSVDVPRVFRRSLDFLRIRWRRGRVPRRFGVAHRDRCVCVSKAAVMAANCAGRSIFPTAAGDR
jgi:hypothetical protein